VFNVAENAVRHGRPHPRRTVDVDGDVRVDPDEPIMTLRASAYAGQVELRIPPVYLATPARPAVSARNPSASIEL
jgi:hypothetical protein